MKMVDGYNTFTVAQVSLYPHEGPGTGGSAVDGTLYTYTDPNTGEVITDNTHTDTPFTFSVGWGNVSLHAKPTGWIDPWEDEIVEYSVRYTPMFSWLRDFSGSVHIGNNTSDAVLEYTLPIVPSGGELNGGWSNALGDLGRYIGSGIETAGGIASGVGEGLGNALGYALDGIGFTDSYLNYSKERNGYWEQDENGNYIFDDDGNPIWHKGDMEDLGWLNYENIYDGIVDFGGNFGRAGGVYIDNILNTGEFKGGGEWLGTATGAFIGGIVSAPIGIIEGAGYAIGKGYADAGNPIEGTFNAGKNLGYEGMEIFSGLGGMIVDLGEKAYTTALTGENQFTAEDIGIAASMVLGPKAVKTGESAIIKGKTKTNEYM